MFSKSKINDPIETREVDSAVITPPQKPAAAPMGAASASAASPSYGAGAAAGVGAMGARAPKSAPSIIGNDLTITGNLVTNGDMQVEGTIEGDIRSNLLTVGSSATIRGEIVADDVVVNGRVVGRIRGNKVRLSASARVEGDILHKTIAIESGAHFEGSVQRSEDPTGEGAGPMRHLPGPGRV